MRERELAVTDFPSSVVRSHDDLIVAIRAVKEFLGLSNETKSWARPLALILGALGIRLRVEIDPEQAKRVAARWARRNERQVRYRELRAGLWFADPEQAGTNDKAAN